MRFSEKSVCSQRLPISPFPHYNAIVKRVVAVEKVQKRGGAPRDVIVASLVTAMATVFYTAGFANGHFRDVEGKSNQSE